MSRPRLLVAGNFHWHAGYSQTVAGYVRAAESAGCEVRISGPLSRTDDEVSRRLPVEPNVRWGTHLVIMFEARQFLDAAQIELALTFPRSRRVIVDFDGHWGDEKDLGGDGTSGRYSAESWHALYSELSDVVLQPRVSGPMPSGARSFVPYVMPDVRHPAELGADRDYDLQYIGSNWWRWAPLAAVVEAAAPLCPALRIRVCGRWWDDATCPGFEDATAAVPGWLAERGVEVCPPVPFGTVVAETGRAMISPILVRPLVAGCALLTPRMFETVASGSLPVLPVEAEFLLAVYGDDAAALCLGAEPTATLARIGTDVERHARIVGAIQDRLRAEYSPRRVLGSLLASFE